MKRTMAIIAGLVAFAFPAPVSAASAQTGAAQSSLQWLECAQQQPSGQIGPSGANANPIARSAETALSLAAAGDAATTFHRGARSLADYLAGISAAQVRQTTTPVGTGGELLLARVAQPNTGPTAEVVSQLTAAFQPTGEYGGDIFSDALAILGLAAAGQQIPPAAVIFLRNAQNATDHGWSFDNAGQFGSDSNTTSLVIQSLLAAGVPATDAGISNGFAYLQAQFQNGGFVFATTAGTTPDANSDELAIQAIVAGQRDTDAAWAARLAAAQGNLASLQVPAGQPDAGALKGFDKLYGTTLAATAFLGQPLTVHAMAATTISLPSCPAAATTAPPNPAPRLAQTGGGLSPLGLLAVATILWLAGLVLWRRRPA